MSSLALEIMREVHQSPQERTEEYFSSAELDSAEWSSLVAQDKRKCDAAMLGREPDADLIEWRRV